MVKAVDIMTCPEIAAVIADLKRKHRSVNTRQNLILFRLAVCCGLRVSEIVGLRLTDVRVDNGRPHILVPSAIAKRNKERVVPLWWDGATLADLVTWKAERLAQGATPTDPFICNQAKGHQGKPMNVRNAQSRFKHCLDVLGSERRELLHIHCGRHSFCSHALAGGRSLVEVRDAAGHANVSTTSGYLHLVDDGGQIGTLFAF